MDVLLLNAWVNESGWSSAVVGMRNSIAKLKPTVMIPGHIQELLHVYVPSDPRSRVPYSWALRVVDEPIVAEVQVMAGGERYLFSEEGREVTVEESEKAKVPSSFSLSQNYPNPFNPITAITYDLPKTSDVTLTLYTITGQKAAVLLDGYQESGHHRILFDGAGFGTGVYLYRLEAGTFVETRRMVLIK